jgi:hypothetical protein
LEIFSVHFATKFVSKGLNQREGGFNVSNKNPSLNEIARASDVPNKQPREKNLVDITNLIRSVQRSEGNPDCFQRAKDYCDRTDCAWRQYCLQSRWISERKEPEKQIKFIIDNRNL